MMRDAARGYGLRVHGRAKTYAPPFLMLGVNLENTTSSDFRITATARYLAFDVVGSGSELRLDGTVGSDPTLAVELYRPIGPTPLFVAPYAAVGSATFNLIEDDAVIARYRQNRLPRRPERRRQPRARAAMCVSVPMSGAASASIKVGDPGFPELRGKETGAEIVWRLDTQDSPVVPSRRPAVRGPAVAHLQRSRHRGGRRDVRLRLVADTAVGDGQSILERRSTQSGVRVRRPRHVVR